MNIRLHIEHLVLDGLPLHTAQGPLVQAAVAAELTRLLTEGSLAPGFQQGGARAYARGADLHLSPTPAPTEVGQRVGQAIYDGLST